MTRFSRLSVADKIRLIITFSSGIALCITALVLVILEVQTTKEALQQRITVMANVVTTHSTAALTFEDRETANRLLNSMAAEESIQQAVIYGADKALFAQYIANTTTQPKLIKTFSSNKTSSEFTLQQFVHHAPIVLKGEVIGQLRIRASLQPLYKRLLVYLSTVLLVLLIMITAVYYLSAYMHKRISDPLNRLLHGMNKISTEQDYSLRIRRSDHDEIGDIVAGFNQMIATIEERDILLSKKQSEIEQHALFDTLTGLANRRQLTTLLEKQLANIKRDGHCGAVLFLDLDHFKTINDSLGHSTGDDLLVNVAQRITLEIRSSDTAARIGGDEFIILLTNLGPNKETAANHVLRIAESVRYRLSQPFNISNRALYTSPSIGICLFDQEDESAEEIIMKADMAMYRAKDNGRNLVIFFSQDMQRLATKRLQIEQDLRATLERGSDELELYYQPQVDYQGRIKGAEALLRWHHPVEGFMPPDTFIPIAETTGLVSPLGNWVLKTACQQLAEWQEQGLNLNLAINLSPNEFLHKNFPRALSDIIKASGIDPRGLELEITERVLLRNTDDVISIMHSLQKHGVQFSIDDFGTGYSSLRYLKMLPLHTLKIDKSFVRDILNDPNDAAIIQAVISMAGHLGLEVIAEGVELEAQCTALHKYGCTFYQGYYFGKPLPIDEFNTLFSANNTALNKLNAL